MKRRHYDAVFLGSAIEPLVSAALLAKRGFRVLVLGQGTLPATYTMDGQSWPRRPHTFLAAHSPVARRVIAELALGQVFRQRATAMDPSFQLVAPGLRMDATTDEVAMRRELEREMPEVRPVVDDFHELAMRIEADLDRLLVRDLSWPPETFFERRDFARATTHQSFDRKGGGMHLFGELPASHPFRLVVRAPAIFGSHADPAQLTELAQLRLYLAWWRGAAKIEGGEAWLLGALADKVQTYGGEIRPDVKASRILVRRGTATGVELAGSGEEVGANFVIHGGGTDSLTRLVPGSSLRPLFERYGEPSVRYYRYTLNVEVPAEAVPMGMASDVFAVRDPRRPMAGSNLLRIEARPMQVAGADPDGRHLLTIESLLERHAVEESSNYLDGMRERVLGALAEVVPFLGQHILRVDSPHDGRDLQDLARRRHVAPAKPWGRGPRTMTPVHAFPAPGPLGLSAYPARTPIKRLLLCSAQAVPALGQEGSLLAATTVARLVTKSDRRKERMRRGLWTKAEL